MINEQNNAIEDVMYHDYASWIMENDDKFTTLASKEANLILRFKPIFDVLAFLYDQKLETHTLSEDEEFIFSFGFGYLFVQFEHINLLLEHTYNGDIDELIKHEKDIIFYLTAMEFVQELEEIYKEEPDQLEPLSNIVIETIKAIEDKVPVDKQLYEKLDTVTERLYLEKNIDNVSSITDFFYDIADELDLLDY